MREHLRFIIGFILLLIFINTYAQNCMNKLIHYIYDSRFRRLLRRYLAQGEHADEHFLHIARGRAWLLIKQRDLAPPLPEGRIVVDGLELEREAFQVEVRHEGAFELFSRHEGALRVTERQVAQ